MALIDFGTNFAVKWGLSSLRMPTFHEYDFPLVGFIIHVGEMPNVTLMRFSAARHIPVHIVWGSFEDGPAFVRDSQLLEYRPSDAEFEQFASYYLRLYTNSLTGELKQSWTGTKVPVFEDLWRPIDPVVLNNPTLLHPSQFCSDLCCSYIN